MHLLFLFLVLSLSACNGKDSQDKASGKNVYTLYRSGAVIQSVRIHVATFETAGESEYWNKDNCEQVAGILDQAKTKEKYPVRFWCEKGRYKE